MDGSSFPPLSLQSWKSTRDTIHPYARLLGKIRQSLTPPQKHWWHISLFAAANGWTTSPIPSGDAKGLTFELLLNFNTHQLIINSSRGEHWQQALTDISPDSLCEESLKALRGMGIQLSVDTKPFAEAKAGTYEKAAAERYWTVVSQIDQIFKEFRGGIRRESSAVQLWPHHLDLSLTWFSGRLVPGIDEEDEENADEQMTFGFSTGDEAIPNPYFYVTAYPLPEGFIENPLFEGIAWHTEGWKGALLEYEEMRAAKDPKAKLLEFLRTVYHEGLNLMR